MKPFKWLIVGAYTGILLGIVHIAATPIIMGMNQQLEPEFKYVFLFMFLAAGVATIFPGFVIVFFKEQLKAGEKKHWCMTIICGVSFSFLGVLAVICMPSNPFAYIALVIGFYLPIASYLAFRAVIGKSPIN